ncbi:MAG: hypothetical protein KF802_10660 [Bdellovibrionaceae bacterium]|nr:hypothetical protein [Pseudobdellovibrionaceae bacterium]MBX3034627.1 hypothetical protein [Pseudobdellovibrionaceae bacterium]
MKKAASLLRVLLPSWRFFERAGQVPQLAYRLLPSDPAPGAWIPCPAPVSRSWRHLVLNPRGNRNLAFHGLVERLMMDLNEWEDDRLNEFSSSVSYALVTEMVKFHLRRDSGLKEGRFQFKIFVADEDVLLSEEHALP